MAAIILTVILCVCLVLYGYGLSYMLKLLGVKHSWLGFIPIINTIALSMRLRDSDGKLPVLRHKLNGTFVSLWPLYCALLLLFVPNTVIAVEASVAIAVIFGGNVFALAYAKIEGKLIYEHLEFTDCKPCWGGTWMIGCVSSVFWVVPLVKFFTYRTKNAAIAA